MHHALASLSRFLNGVRGGRFDEPLCSAIWRNIEDGGWASRVRWPESWVAHFRWSATGEK